MNIPSYMLGAVIVLWGWRSDLLPLAVPMALVVELAERVTWRFSLSRTDFNRIADVSTLSFVLLAIYQFDAHSIRGIYHILTWVPVVLFLLLAAQLYSTRETVEYTALFLSVRRAVARGTMGRAGSVDMRKPFIVVCLVSAAVKVEHDYSFFACIAALLAWLSWRNRPRRYASGTWLVLFVLAIGIGWSATEGTRELRRVLTPWIVDFFHERAWSRRDPYRAYTAMGQIGRLKSSERIVLRVRPELGQTPPTLLRQASYQTFTTNMWLAQPSKFDALDASADGSVWRIHDVAGGYRSARISGHFPRGKGLLAVPGGTFRVEELPVEDLYRNPLGVLKVLRGPEFVEYRTHYSPGDRTETATSSSDISMPVALEELVGSIADELGLRSMTPLAAVAAVQRYFADGFRYTLALDGPRNGSAPLHRFLLETRAGHCEFFATATVLLLRAAGLPARYATGFSVQEWSELEQQYVVRRRHAHSWALVHVDGAWLDVDTTPAQWVELETMERPWWTDGYDVVSWLRMLYAKWRWDETSGTGARWLLWLLVPLLLVLVWRLRRRQRIHRSDEAVPAQGAPAPGLDSEIFAIERLLSESGRPRARGESLAAWMQRLDDEGRLPDAELLRGRLLGAHYRYRFDPYGLSTPERDALRNLAQQWLRAHVPSADNRGKG